jgi:cation:H+ antiporter
MISFFTLAAGLAVLLGGADLLVRGASAIAIRAGISHLVIGLTIVSLGTSMPEMIVTSFAGAQGKPDLAIGSVLGSNIANVLLVLGVAAVIKPLPVQNSTVVSEIPFSLMAALLVGFLANAALLSDSSELSLSRIDGLILLFFFGLFILYIYKVTRGQLQSRHEVESDRGIQPARAAIYCVAGMIGLFFGGEWVISGATGLAEIFGMPDAIIGLTVVAIGTSSPELIASAMAAYRGETDIAVGNVVGSNIFNLLWVLGLTSSIRELPFQVISNTDILAVIASSTLVILALGASRRLMVLRSHGILFLVVYASYLFYLAQRG